MDREYTIEKINRYQRSDQVANEIFEMVLRRFWSFFVALRELFQDVLNRAAAIEAFPNKNPYGIKTKGIAGIGIEKNGPVIELLMVNYLAQGSGVIIHSCGIARNGRGILFVGESGAGKSTLARMWDQEDGIDVLSDDRTIVRKRGHQFWMYGTPWHGDAKFGSPRGVRLERIFFLRHGQKNSIKEIKGIDPVSKLLTCSFPPYWDPQGMAFTLEILTDLTADIPCQSLSFRPERSAIDHIIEELRD